MRRLRELGPANEQNARGVQIWNKHVFGNLFVKKCALLRKIKNISTQLYKGWNNNLTQSQAAIWKQYEKPILAMRNFFVPKIQG